MCHVVFDSLDKSQTNYVMKMVVTFNIKHIRHVVNQIRELKSRMCVL
jgi:hypothetical protein